MKGRSFTSFIGETFCQPVYLSFLILYKTLCNFVIQTLNSFHFPPSLYKQIHPQRIPTRIHKRKKIRYQNSIALATLLKIVCQQTESPPRRQVLLPFSPSYSTSHWDDDPTFVVASSRNRGRYPGASLTGGGGHGIDFGGGDGGGGGGGGGGRGGSWRGERGR